MESPFRTGPNSIAAIPSGIRLTRMTHSASYMVATTASLDRLSTLLGRPMPIVRLRPNVLLAPAPGAELRPWVEDYWSKITIGAASFSLTSNCVRCTSLNLDYNTGRPLTGPNLPFA